jgi:hypothetical protein
MLLFLLGAIALGLGLKYLRQYLSLLFTQLSLKVVWIVLVVLAVLTLLNKKADCSC